MPKNNFQKTPLNYCEYNKHPYLCLIKSHNKSKSTMSNQYWDSPTIPSPHHIVPAEIHSAIMAHQYTKTASAFALSMPNASHSLSFEDDVEACFSSCAEKIDEDYAIWQESVRSQARQIYLLEKAGDKSENEAARAAIQFIHKKATA